MLGTLTTLGKECLADHTVQWPNTCGDFVLTEVVGGTFDFSTGKGCPALLLPPLPGWSCGEEGPVLELQSLVTTPSIEWMWQELGISPLSRLRARWYNKSFLFGV